VWFCRPDGLKLDEKKRISGYWDYFMLGVAESVVMVSI
jgi:hypothetical protein